MRGRCLLLALCVAASSCGDEKAGDGAEVEELIDTPAADTAHGEVADAPEVSDVVSFDLAPDDTAAPSADADFEIVPGEFGSACIGNVDCLDGFCVEGPEGGVCTRVCDAECPDGFDCRGVQSGSADIVFLCLPRVARLCVACKADYQCPNGGCIGLGDVAQCSFRCDDDADCPGGYRCEPDPLRTHPGEFCLPKSGNCDCTPDLSGAVRTCLQDNEHGTCYGVESCDPEVGWVGCNAPTPMAETCDGRDNDCDALVDDGVETGLACDNSVPDVGTCSGLSVCLGTRGIVCTAAVPELEACDFQDNDCDGETDEPFKDAGGVFSLREHCGTCHNDCSGKIADGSGRCEAVAGAAPVCVVAVCDPGYVELNRFQCALPPDIACLPCADEDDCYHGSCIELDGQSVCVAPCGDSGSCPDGHVCQDVAGPESGQMRCVPSSRSCSCNASTDGQARTCVKKNAAGTCYGEETCDARLGWSGCSAHVPAPEVCNGVDDDCSSGIDDVLGRGAACAITNAFGACPGLRDCVAGSEGLLCAADTPTVETCNYLDDDCDGASDETFAELYASCSNGKGACQRFGFIECREDGTGTACNAVAAAPSGEKCDQLDNDCDGATDETFAGLQTSCTRGVGSCARNGVVVCKADGSGSECNAFAGPAVPELCDGLDNDCNGLTDDAFGDLGANCAPGQGACERRGVVVCKPDGSGTECTTLAGTPAEEKCDGIDNDCDGATDEPFPDVGVVCFAGVGACRNAGIRTCAADGNGTTCDAAEREPSDETCDLVDNDCDGATDQSFKNASGAYATDTTCGNCFTDCTAIFAKPHAAGRCDESTPATPSCRMICDAGHFDLDAVPDDGCEFALEAAVLYVAESDPLAKDDAACGAGPSQTAGGRYPCASIGHAIDKAAAAGSGKSRVHVAGGAYNESLELADGISVYGGFNPVSWVRAPEANLTAIFGVHASGHRKTVIADGIDADTTFDGFAVYGQAANGIAENSYAVWVRDSTADLKITNNTIWPGSGGPGKNGDRGGDGGGGSDGTGGQQATQFNGSDCGTQECSGNNPGGGAGANSECSTDTAGGAGASAPCPDYNEQEDLCTSGVSTPSQTSHPRGGDGAGAGAGAGGGGGCDQLIDPYITGCACFVPGASAACPTGVFSDDGDNGADALPGSAGSKNDSVGGQVSAAEWRGFAGGGGAVGGNGAGGGGGGAGGGVETYWEPDFYCASLFTDFGGSGGGGGAGGCGGTGGEGGGGGGGAFGIFSVVTLPFGNDLPDIRDNVIHMGLGGNGGRGGDGGTAGDGGNGGLGGGADPGGVSWCAQRGGKGGEGGDGGPGGGGAGGNGGVAYGLFASGGSLPSWSSDNFFFEDGAGGPGGPGGGTGPGGLAGEQGLPGHAAASNL